MSAGSSQPGASLGLSTQPISLSYQDLNKLTVTEITSLVIDSIPLSRKERATKDALITAVLVKSPPSLLQGLVAAVAEKSSVPEYRGHLQLLQREELSSLTKDEILAAVQGHLTLSRKIRAKKDAIIDNVLSAGSAECFERIRAVLNSKAQSEGASSVSRRKRGRAEEEGDDRGQGQNKRTREEEGDSEDDESSTDAESTPDSEPKDDTSDVDEGDLPTPDFSQFLQAPTTEQVKECHRQFIAATSNSAVAFSTCAVCARELQNWEAGIQTLSIEDIPNLHRLSPRKPHPHHTLFQGALLEPSGVQVEDGATNVTCCKKCLDSLRAKDSKNLPPKFSLANDLWIGKVPWELQTLTIAEQLLIAHIYPRVYVFKMFPKRWFGRKDTDNPKLQRGMRGTVSSYALDMDSIVSMLEGKLMPRRPSILASVVSITFLGLGSLPTSWLKTTFRVRRANILTALRWLQKWNPRYYGDISISDEHLQALPEDDVPLEIMQIVRHSPDASVVDLEASGYVPDADEGPIVSGQTPCFTEHWKWEYVLICLVHELYGTDTVQSGNPPADARHPVDTEQGTNTVAPTYDHEGNTRK